MFDTKKTIIDNIEDRNQDKLNVKAFESLGGEYIDYKTFFEIKNLYAKAFLEMGVKEGDVVTICAAGTLDTVLNFAGLNEIGAIAQFVNPNYFLANPKKYIDETGSKLLIILDRFYPQLKNSIAQTNIKNIVCSSISEYSSTLYKVLARRKEIKPSDKIEGINYINLPDFVKLGQNSQLKIDKLPYVENRPSVITYTSGTTGDPKGVVHTNDSINNMIEIYELAHGFGVEQEDRNLVLIPPLYMTSFVHSIFAPMTLGTTNILQPVYNPEALGKDLKKYEPQTVIASKAHYINLENSNLKKDSLSFVKFAYCGGEAITKPTAIRINDILNYYGIPPMVIGYGQTEYGTMTMFNTDIPFRTNESGILIPGIKAQVVDLKTGLPAENGTYGELLIQSPATMLGYYKNQEATDKFFFTNDDGEIWTRTGDIAAVKYQYNGQDVYDVVGRKKDSFTNENGDVVFLFNIENLAEEVDGIREAEAIALTIDDVKHPIVHVVLRNNITKSKEEIIRDLDSYIKSKVNNESEIPFAYKIRDKFNTSPISGKRDYESLQFETDNYIRVLEDGSLEVIPIYSEESKVTNDFLEARKVKF